MLIWNPWHGCKRISEGCDNCYMYYLDSQRGMDGSKIYKVKNNFDLPLKHDKTGEYRIKSGSHLHVCLTSDFFLEEADCWRADVWDIMRKRPDVFFCIITKRAERIEKCLPKDWGEGWENVRMTVTCENQKRADQRIPILLSLPFKHKGIMMEPMIGEISIEKYLHSGEIEQVLCGGENYSGARPLNFEWVKKVYAECLKHNITFNFFETGNIFIKDGKKYRFSNKRMQSEMAKKSGLTVEGLKKEIILKKLPEQISMFEHEKSDKIDKCAICSRKSSCPGCNGCGMCM